LRFSNGSACPTAGPEPEVKPVARDAGAVREADMTVPAGESISTPKTIAEGEVSPSVSEAVYQSSATSAAQHCGTVTAAVLLPQTEPSTSTETKGLLICVYSLGRFHLKSPCFDTQRMIFLGSDSS